jgi:DNA-binding NtrC family response regulator
LLKATNRTDALNQLQELVSKAARGRILVVHGAQGVGQHELVTHLRENFNAQGLVLEGRCRAGHDNAPLLEIVRALAQAGPEACDQAALTAFLSENSQGDNESELQALMERVRSRDLQSNTSEAFRRLLCDAAERQRVVVALHDLHLADDDTLAVVNYLVEDIAGSHAMGRIGGQGHVRPVLVLTLCDDSPDGRKVLDQLKAHMNIETLGLERLDADGLSECLKEPVLAEKLLRITDGLPQRVRMLVEVLPEDLEFLVRARLVELSDGALRILQLARLFDRPVAAAALAVLTQTPRATVDSLLSDGFLCVDSTSGSPFVSIADVYSGHRLLEVSDSKTQVAMHQQCAEHLTTLHSVNGDESLLEAVSRHHLAAGDVDTAAQYALDAAQWLRSRAALHRAAELLETVLDQQPSQRDELTLSLVDIRVAMGGFDQALALCRSLDEERGESIQLRLAQIHRLSGDLAAAQDALERLWSDDGLNESQRALVRRELADVHLRRGNLDEAQALCDEAEGSDAALNHTLGKVAFWRGRWETAEALYDTVLSQLPGDDAAVERGDVLHNLGLVSLRRGRYGEACRRIQDGLALIEAQGAYFRATVCRHNLAIAHEYQQSFSFAIPLFEQCIEDFERLGKRANLAGALNSLGDLYLTLGDSWRARKLLDYSLEVSRANGLDYMETYNELKLARLEWVDGHLESAGTLAQRAMKRFKKLGHAEELADAQLILARVLAAQGDSDAASTLLEGMSADGSPENYARGQILRARLLADDKPAVASRMAEQAARSLAALGQRDGVAQARFEAAASAKLAGRQDEAERCIEMALEALNEFRSRVPSSLAEGFAALPWVRQFEEWTQEPADNLATEAATEPETAEIIPLTGRKPRARRAAKKTETFHGFIGESPQMLHVYEIIRRLGDAQAPILITGESGTGKELVASAIRAESLRRNKPFVRVNAAAFVETLLESELFGHEKGAFTGAASRKLGAFEQADGGTLFLDEIGDISAKTQVSLLRVMQEREIRRVGGRHPIKVDVRILCATNRNLEAMVEDGSFRLDLYYRIKGLNVDLPPLRERAGDLRLLCDFILDDLGKKHGRFLSLASDGVKVLEGYRWPGNVRELENVLRSVYFFAQSEKITADELITYTLLKDARRQDRYRLTDDGDDASPIGQGFNLADAKRTLEIKCIKRALVQTNGNITKAASLLGMKRPRLSQKIKEFGLKART